MSENKIKYQFVRDGDSSDCIDNMCNLISNNLKLTRDQIISISMHDALVKHGDLETVVFYRENSTQPDAVPLAEDISNVCIEKDEDTEWDVILEETLLNANGKECLAIGATFRNVGEEKISCAIMAEGHAREIYEKKFST